ncbi:MAG TPA: hypothetical protein VMY37_27405 [Thermoguttaceae bacterium]|nr:hypothetical protein [Thermoguttaceae bacterium]
MTRYASRSPEEPAGRFQYSLRSLLLVTTFCCLGLALLRHLAFPEWALGALAVLAWSGVVAGQGGAALAAAAGYRRRRREADFWLSLRRRWAVYLAAAGAVGPVATFLLFVVVFAGAGLDADRLDRCFDPFRGSAEHGWRSAWPGIWTALLFLNPAGVLLNAISCPCYFRPRQDVALLLVRALGLLNSLAATGVTVAFCANG